MTTVKIDDNGVPLDPTSSLNNYFMCVCGKRVKFKSVLIRHVTSCTRENKSLVCRWCKLEFKNRGNLINHGYHMHGDKKKLKTEYKCDVCDATFSDRWKIRFHVRRYHFNLWARTPRAISKRVNQVWFEKVLNTNLIMEMKKTGDNRLVMRPTHPNADLKIHDINKMVDLRNQYPINPNQQDERCKMCGKTFRKYVLKKHMDEIHLNLTKHKCNNCNMTFKRSYIYLQHVCNKNSNRKAKLKGVRHEHNSEIRITSVRSMNCVDD